ncbi:MAG: hypothetical protein MK135_01975 [Polyangiaceae bacterium]|nr:hypothetical protein [Polyangiaceae bacterium]
MWGYLLGAGVLLITVNAGAAEAIPTESPQKPGAGKLCAKNHQSPWGLTIGFGYASATSKVLGLKLNPYGSSLSIHGTYTWCSGFRLGLYGEGFLGSTISQDIKVNNGAQKIEIRARSRTGSLGTSFGYAQPLGSLALHYQLGIGLTVMRYDFGDIPFETLASFEKLNGVVSGLHLRPSLGLELPLNRFYLLTSIYSRIESSSKIPAAFGGLLSFGARL